MIQYFHSAKAEPFRIRAREDLVRKKKKCFSGRKLIFPCAIPEIFMSTTLPIEKKCIFYFIVLSLNTYKFNLQFAFKLNLF